VRMISRLWHSPDRATDTGTSTTGSSEAVMLGGLALRWTWPQRRQAAGLRADRPNPGEGHQHAGGVGEVPPLPGRRTALRPPPRAGSSRRSSTPTSRGTSGCHGSAPSTPRPQDGDPPTFALNFSRPGAQVIAQYYDYIRLGFEACREVQQACRHTARYLAGAIAGIGPNELLSDGRSCRCPSSGSSPRSPTTPSPRGTEFLEGLEQKLPHDPSRTESFRHRRPCTTCRSRSRPGRAMS
jgi:hypothetical protein